MGYMDMTIDGASGRRWNTANAYLRPALADKSRKVRLASHPTPPPPHRPRLRRAMPQCARARAASRRVRAQLSVETQVLVSRVVFERTSAAGPARAAGVEVRSDPLLPSARRGG
jgi:hypothetical protein